jgi:prepilin-type N-terminal cleavage/methylation domain-containing protein
MKSRSEHVPHGRNQMKRGGFTLIEIVVVITIIAILTSLGLMVGNKVRVNSQVTATRTMIQTLDAAMNAVEAEKGSKVPGVWRDDMGNEYAVVDGQIPMGGPPLPPIEPSQGLMFLASGQHPSLKEAILRVDSKYVSNVALTSGQTPGAGPALPSVPVVKDAWGNAIRYVHPRFDGGYGPFDAQGTSAVGAGSRPTLKFKAKLAGGGTADREFVRSYRPTSNMIKSADEGLCTGGRGYFYSSGLDNDAGTRDDNVYLDAPPKFPSETANLH